MAAGFHNILTTIMLNVMGRGLALNGPPGSVSKVVFGFRKETTQVLSSFFLMGASYAMSCIGLFYLVMSDLAAYASTFIIVLAVPVWYYYCNRIINRFHFVRLPENSLDDDENSKNKNKKNRSKSSELSEPYFKYTVRYFCYFYFYFYFLPLSLFFYHYFLSDFVSIDNPKQKFGFASMRNFFKKIDKSKKDEKKVLSRDNKNFEMCNKRSGPIGDNYFDNVDNNDIGNDIIDNILTDKADDIILLGYMFKKGFGKFIRKTGLKISEEPWKRLYFSLCKKGELRYYHNKKDYLSNREGNSIKSRAIIVSEYKIVHLVKDIEKQQLLAEKNITDEDIDESLTSSSSTEIGVSLSMPISNYSLHNKRSLTYDFMLVPYDDNDAKDWTFRVDTAEEFHLWIENLRLFSKYV